MEKKILGINLNFLTASGLERIKEEADTADIEVRVFETEPGLEELLPCQILFGNFDATILNKCENLEWFASSFAGVDKYCHEGVLPENVILTTSSGAYGITISEHMICVLLMMMRRFPEYIRQNEAHKWIKLAPIKAIYGSNILVVGMGDIGSNFAIRTKAMGARLSGVRQNVNDVPSWCDNVYPLSSLKDIAGDFDVIVNSLPATDETVDIFNKEVFDNMKEGSYFINVGRGASVDEDALVEALTSGHLSGAALDVFKTEPIGEDSRLYDLDNLIITPHISGDSAWDHTCEIVFDLFTDNLARFIKGEKLENTIDVKRSIITK